MEAKIEKMYGAIMKIENGDEDGNPLEPEKLAQMDAWFRNVCQP